MRIVLVNWARIWDGARKGGGVNGYCQSLALELAARGHEVHSLCSGTAHEPDSSNRSFGPCFVRHHEDWQGIAVHEVVNSPVVAPAMAQFRDPLGEIAAPELETVLESFWKDVAPDVVHFHNIEGLSAGCVAAAKRGGARVVYSLHNYHTICPQVYLMQGHRRPCFGFDNGHACEGCIPTVDPNSERLRLASPSEPTKPPAPTRLPPPPWETIDLPAWRPLLNVIQPETSSAKPPNAYCRRREAMVGVLNSCDRVLAVSDFVRRKFESYGVNAAVIQTQHIGCRLVSRPAESKPPIGRPLRIAFTGYHNWFKGLPMLLDSLELLTPEYLRQIDLTLLALNGEQVEPQLRRLQPRLAGLTVRFGYDAAELPGLLSGIDMGIVPSVWWDNAPQTVMEFLACGIPVMAAELGGIPEFVKDGENGLLFRGNDRWDLARRLAWICRERAAIAALRLGIRPPKTMTDHAGELEQVYRNRLS
jgi:glycosyltransferase involved in cell wall biosynthesis